MYLFFPVCDVFVFLNYVFVYLNWNVFVLSIVWCICIILHEMMTTDVRTGASQLGGGSLMQTSPAPPSQAQGQTKHNVSLET